VTAASGDQAATSAHFQAEPNGADEQPATDGSATPMEAMLHESEPMQEEMAQEKEVATTMDEELANDAWEKCEECADSRAAGPSGDATPNAR